MSESSHPPERWKWDARKNAANQRKHGVGFNLASAIFADPLLVWRLDEHEDCDRFQAIGRVAGQVFFVVYAWAMEIDGSQIGRIISARRATPRERRYYERGIFD